MDELEIRAPALRKLVKSDPSIPSYKISEGKMQYKSQLYATKNANGYTELFVDDKQYGRLNYTDLINITKHLNCHRKNKEYYNTNYYGFTSILKDDFESSAINEQGKKYKPLSTQQIKFMLEEISIPDKKLSAYFFANSNPIYNHTLEHVAAVIVLPRNKQDDPLNVIYPFYDNYLDKVFVENLSKASKLFNVDLSLFVDNPPPMQVDRCSCGALAYGIIKQLLNNNAEALNRYSLQLELHDLLNEGSAKYFFFPPPHIFKYAQSYKHIEIFEQILQIKAFKEETKLKCTFVDILQKYKVFFIDSDGERKEFTSEMLQAFTKKWQEKLYECKAKRELMIIDNSPENLLQIPGLFFAGASRLSKSLEYLRYKIKNNFTDSIEDNYHEDLKELWTVADEK